MSKFIPDPCIQQSRAARSGDIALALGGGGSPITIGEMSVAELAPFGAKSVNPVAVDSLVVLAGTPSESPVVGNVFTTLIAVDGVASIAPVAADSTVAITATPTESPVVGVGFATSVV